LIHGIVAGLDVYIKSTVSLAGRDGHEFLGDEGSILGRRELSTGRGERTGDKIVSNASRVVVMKGDIQEGVIVVVAPPLLGGLD
jgi:hypothetical protein